jgi:TolB-like protein/predicted Ser/Thr protein kinase
LTQIDTAPVRSRVADRYTVLSLLGVGGMGSVYRVHDEALDEVVALKLLRRELLDDPRERARFRQEVKLARRVAHPNVARVFDLGEADGEVFLTMEYVDGATLATRIGREAPLPVAEVAALGLALCAGLGAVHDAGIVHRDFKPENVLLGAGGRIALTDFGIARTPSREGALVQTQGLILGTPDYMAPEQVEDQTHLDPRTDLYALGIVLFEMATGRRPFRATTPLATAVERLTTPAPDPRDVRPGLTPLLADLINDCLQRDRTRRPESTRAVASRLEALGTGRTLPMAPPTVALLSGPAPPPRPLPAPELQTSAPGEKKVAVLPFRNVGGPEDAYLADGLADDVTDTLAGLPGLRVRPRATVARAAHEHDEPMALGRALEVDVVVEGTVRRQGDVVRVSARLFCTLNGFALWAQRFEGGVADVFGLTDRVAEGVAGALSVRPAEARTPVQDAQAMELYLRGRRAYHTFWREAAAEAVELLAEAARRAPENATILSAYAMALARAYAMDAAGPDLHERLAAACDAVLARAPDLAGPHVARASLHFQIGDPVTAGRELRAALLAKADLADGRELLGRMLTELGDLDAGIGHLHVARALEPAMHHTTLSVARAEALRGQPDLADALLSGPQAAGVTPNLLWVARARLAMWRRDTGTADRIEAEMADVEFPLRAQVQGTLAVIRAPHRAPAAIATLEQFTVARTGATPRLRTFFAQLTAEFRALAGERTAAIAALVEADALGLVDIAWLDRCPLFAGFDGDPAFVAVRERVRARAHATLDALAGR